MDVHWDQGRFRYRAWDQQGHLLAEVESVMSPDGEDRGWRVFLPLEHRDLFRYYPTPEEAKDAAQTAIDAAEARDARHAADSPGSEDK